MFLQSLSFAIQVTLPITLIIFLGIFLRKIKWIDEEFASVGSRLVFNITLPCLLFVNIAKTDLSATFPVHLVVVAAVLTTVLFVFFHFLAYKIQSVSSRGAFVQGACRGNMAIIGLAFCVNAFGDEALSLASMYLSVIVILFNVYSILTLYFHQDENPSFGSVAKSVLTNPLAIAIISALLVAYFTIQVPSLLIDTGKYIAAMTLPLALLCVGASIRLHEFRSSRLLYCAIVLKVILIPFIMTIIAYALGVRGVELGILYIMMATPTATAAYPMVRSIGGDYYLTAAIIAGTTLLSMVTTAVGLFLLRFFQWI